MVEWNRGSTPWRQGSLLGSDAVNAFELHHPTESKEQILVIVASHDCDLTQDPRVEPDIEVLVGRQVTKNDGTYAHAKNLRKLQLQFEGAPAFWGEFEAVSKTAIDKKKLNRGFFPRTDTTLSPENKATFQLWLASRYRRSAFPDEFESRLTDNRFKLHEKIAKAVKPHGQLITGVFFDVDEGKEVVREGADDTYKLDIIILYATDSLDFDATTECANSAAKSIEQAFENKLFKPENRWKYIELSSCEAISESALSYHMFKQLKRWKLDYISLAANPQQPVVTE